MANKAVATMAVIVARERVTAEQGIIGNVFLTAILQRYYKRNESKRIELDDNFNTFSKNRNRNAHFTVTLRSAVNLISNSYRNTRTQTHVRAHTKLHELIATRL